MRHSLVPVSLGLVALLVAGCGTNSTTPADTFVGQFMRGSTQEPTTIDANLLEAAVVCPVVKIQPDTGFIRREVEGATGDAGLRWQASITETARECKKDPEGIAIRVGVTGRVIEGPRGAPDKVELPLRVVVREGGEVTYSRLHSVQVTVDAPSKTWAYVDENVFTKAPKTADIVVGFDG